MLSVNKWYIQAGFMLLFAKCTNGRKKISTAKEFKFWQKKSKLVKGCLNKNLQMTNRDSVNGNVFTYCRLLLSLLNPASL